MNNITETIGDKISFRLWEHQKHIRTRMYGSYVHPILIDILNLGGFNDLWFRADIRNRTRP